MGHNHSDYNHGGHSHSHSHAPVITNLNQALIIGIFLNLAYVNIQIVIGLKINSLSLLSDAGHNFLAVAGLVLCHCWYCIQCKNKDIFLVYS